MNWPLLANSLLVAGAATVLALVFGTAVAVTLTAVTRPLRRVLLILTIMVLALPSFLVTNAWIDLLGTNGILHPWLPVNIFSLRAAAGILALLLWPIPALAVWGAWQKLEPVHFEIDTALKGFKLLRHLLWPAGRANLGISTAMVFALALNNFAVPAILQVKVFTAEVWVNFNTNLDALGAFQRSWPLWLAPICLLLLLRRREVPWPRETGADIARLFRQQLGKNWLSVFVTMATATLLLALVTPLVQLVATARTWSELPPAFTAGRTALVNSFVYSASAAAIALALSILLARVRVLGWTWFLFLVPGVFLGIGALTVFNWPGFYFFSRTAGIVVALLVVRYFALGHSMSSAAIGSVDSTLLDSARIDGARGLALFRRIVFPQTARSLAAVGYMIYLLCLWDVETILLVIPPGGETLALRIFNLLHYGHNSHVNALCILLLLVALSPLIVFSVAVAVKRRLDMLRATSVKASAVRFTAAATVIVLLTAGCREQLRDAGHTFPIQSSIFSHVEIIGSRGTGPGEFNKPRSLALDTNDNLFVVDMTGRVQKFSPQGKFLLSWQMPQTDLGKPKGMCRDREGNIVVLEPHYQRVNHFTPEGKLVAQWGTKGTNVGELTLPRAIAVDTKNNVIVSEYTLVDRVQKFSTQGRQCLAAWGTPGLANGEFNRAEGVCVDAGDRIYVADSCNHRIQVFSPDGKFLRAHGKAGEARGQMSYPYDVRVDDEGRQYVCEFGNSRIQIFDAKDQPVEIIGRAGGEPGEFANPWSIALDSKGNLYVADSQNHRVQKLVRSPRSKVQGPRSNLVADQFGLRGQAQRDTALAATMKQFHALEKAPSPLRSAGAVQNAAVFFNSTLDLGPWTLDTSHR